MRKTDRKSTESANRRREVWKRLRPIAAFLIAATMVSLAIVGAVNYVLSIFVYPVDSTDATPIQVAIPSGMSASGIAKILVNACGEGEEGLIKATASFKIYVDFVGKANNLKAGTYFLSKNMSISEIVDVLCEGNSVRQTVRFTIPEGYTVEETAKLLYDQGIITDTEAFLVLCDNPQTFSKYEFISSQSFEQDRRYALEGYLFPDTYEVYTDATSVEILSMMLDRFDEIYTQEYADRAEELGMTLDSIICLASIIEREAQVSDDFAKVSAVFHNRLAAGMKLESCATLSYVMGVTRYSFSEDEISTISPYNTYRNNGLPVGPICNPGVAAIEAALYPNTEYAAENYLYFCNGNPSVSRELIFSKTYEEHLENVERYSPFWN
ncbi:MAG TPA: endolytic transglycosylase MltG [Eubacteriales bacterium]|nr:endolytic transglycosylase MltG [Eubacteriales bacterium]